MTLFELANRYNSLKEVPGVLANEEILNMLRLDVKWPQEDEVPWCSAFVNFIAWQLRLPRTRSLQARSWLRIGSVLSLTNAIVGNDIVILSRGSGEQPGPDVVNAPGHVGIFAGLDQSFVYLLGGNQHDEVNISPFSRERVLGVRRLT